MMIELEDGNYVTSRLVRKIFTVQRKDEGRKTKLSLEGDGEYTTASYAMGNAEEIARRNDKIIKAEPGYKLVMFAADDYYGFDFSIEGEVIAWRIDPQKYGSRKPITISADEDEHPYVILCPDGKIIVERKNLHKIPCGIFYRCDGQQCKGDCSLKSRAGCRSKTSETRMCASASYY